MKTTINYPYKFKLKPTKSQFRLLSMFGGTSRFIYNHYLAKDKIKVESFNDKCKDLTILKHELPWLKDVSSWILQQKLKDLQLGWDRCFKKLGGKPSFKKKYLRQDSFRFPNHFKLEDDRVFLPKLGWIRFHKSQEVNGELRSMTVKQETDGWYVVILTRQEIEITPQGFSPIGIDLGIKTFATLSDGTEFKTIKPLKRYLMKLVREQRRLSKKVKGSSNRGKQRAKVARVYKKVSNTRNDYLHKTSTWIAKNHSLVCVEDLNVKGMVKNRKLARAISDQGWSRFVSMLEYKCNWYGSSLKKVDRWFASSKICCSCGCKKDDLELSDRIYVCENCDLTIDRDINAAINIVNKGTVGHTETKSQDLNACGDQVRPKLTRVRRRSLKQEPIRKNSLKAVLA